MERKEAVLTREQYEWLTGHYKNQMEVAERSQMSLGIPAQEMKKVYDVYNDAYITHESNLSCGNCRVKILAKLAWLCRHMEELHHEWAGVYQQATKNAPTDTEKEDAEQTTIQKKTTRKRAKK